MALLIGEASPTGPAPVDVSALLDQLTGDVARQLRRRGASSLQVNVTDGGLGQPHGIPPSPGSAQVHAMISYWLSAAGEDGAHSDILPSVDGRTWYGYLVVEAVQLTGPPVPVDGSRSTGFTQIVPLSVPREMSWAEWRRRWQGAHTSVAIETQSSFRYVQNVVVRPLDDGAPAYAAVVEESFPLAAASDSGVFYDAQDDPDRLAGNTRRMMESCATFMDGLVPIAWTAEYHLPD